MISSNGGSWNNDSDANNKKVLTFKFKEPDIVQCDYEPSNRLIRFTKLAGGKYNEYTNDVWEMEISLTPNAMWVPCVLMFHNNCMVDFINNFNAKNY